MTNAGDLFRDAQNQAIGATGQTDKIDEFGDWLNVIGRNVSQTANIFRGSEITKSLLVRDTISSTIFSASSGWQIKGDGTATFRSVTISGGSLLITNTTNRIHLQSDGDAFFGSDISAAATTSFSIFSNAQTYNSESIGAGDVLVGDNSATKPNLFWDASTGRLQLRSGTTVIGQMGASTGLAMTGARITRAANQTIATATETYVQFDTEDYDDASFWNPTTNYCKNPSFEVNVTDDWTFWQAGAGGSANLDATQYKVGAKSCRIRSGTATARVGTTASLSVPNGSTVTVQCWVRCSADPTGNKVALSVSDGLGQNNIVYASAAANGAWEYLTCSCANTSGVARTFYLYCYNSFNDSAADVWFDGCQLELATAATTYCDGTRAACIWTGTAHNSTSMRVGFVIPTGRAGRYSVGFYLAAYIASGASAGRWIATIMSSQSTPGIVQHAHDLAVYNGVSWFAGGAITERDLIEGEGITVMFSQAGGVNATLVGATYAPTHLWLRRVR